MTNCAPPLERDHKLSPARVASRSAFADLLRAYFDQGLQHGEVRVVDWSITLGVSQQKMRKWSNKDHVHSPIAAGDLHALPPAALAGLLRFWLAQTEAKLAPVAPAGDPRLLCIQVSIEIGETAKSASLAMADRTVTGLEWKELEAKFSKIEAEARAARLACEAARAAAGGGRHG